MFEKTVIALLKGLSAVVYAAIFILIFSMPVIFIYQAFKPPVFEFSGAAIITDLSQDSYLLTADENSADWQKIEFSLTASSGALSPYSYIIEEFSAEENEILENAEDYRIVLDAPIEFTKDEKDSFTLSVYVKTDNEAELYELAGTISFKAETYEKSFGEFSLKFGNEA